MPTEKRVGEQMVDAKVIGPPGDGRSDDIILEARNLQVQFGGFYAVNGVNLKVRRGGIHALIGPNGAGKTTCFNLMTKFITPTSGEIYFKKKDITRMSSAEVARLGMVRSFQISAVFAGQTVLENVRSALQRRKRGNCFDFWRSDRSLNELNDECVALLDEVGIAALRNVRAGELAYGSKRALELATTLALDPEMMLLDEPTAGMAKADVDRVVGLIGSIADRHTILMVEHNLSVVSSLSKTITVLASGKVIAEGDYKSISQVPQVRDAYLGSSAHA